MDTMILYGSRYGHARRYAEKLSEQTGFPAVSYLEKPDLTNQKMIVYLGGLYAGGVRGLSKTLRSLSLQTGQMLILATVGLADTTKPENRENIRRSLQRQLPDELFDKAKIFYLRGGIDYQKLSFVHRMMMRALYQSLRRQPAGQQTEETRVLLETYGKQVDFMDFNALNPIIQEMTGGNERSSK